MKDFFKFMFASMLGTVILMIIAFLISFGILAVIIASASSDETVISKNTILHLRFDKPIIDRAPKMNLMMNFSGPEKMTGLDVFLENLNKAKRDENISGIYLDLTTINADISTLDEIREALFDFKTSGKFIWAYSEYYSQTAYYLATSADRIFVNPEGGIDFKGLASEMVFIKGLLEKLDIRMQVIRHGKFKAATEPLFLDKMSKENREQITVLITDIWDHMLSGISETRKISRQEAMNIADSLKIETAGDALKYKLVDQLVYKDELIKEMKKKLNLNEKKKLLTVSLEKYENVSDPKKNPAGKEKIAVIYAIGSIAGGEGDDQSIGSERISKAIRKAREDDKVKAIVFRINSGGGSALASDVIWREIDLARKTKPVVASLGGVAASGGYYIACAASKIVSDPTTITGSIGVFGVVPNFEGLFSKKLGITFDWAMTNKNGDYIPVTKPLSPYQTKKIQRDVDHIYEVFTGKVAAGRNLEVARVDSIGQGRVWSGTDAKTLGLVDEFGGLTRAIELAAELASVKDYRIWSLPEQKEWFEELINQITGNDPTTRLQQALGEDYRLYRYYMDIKEMKGIQARMLYQIEIH
ncbi:MAG: signal peptide peptidase SppA [Alphaproteobacteria bacterium]|nr:signal peptide peptidase SppA [Alphaproteobacteria bacterium]